MFITGKHEAHESTHVGLLLAVDQVYRSSPCEMLAVVDLEIGLESGRSYAIKWRRKLWVLRGGRSER